MTGNRDSLGYYRVLWVEPTATEEQIQLAFDMLCELPPEQRRASMPEIERAYSILKNPVSRQAYDRAELLARKVRKPSRLNDVRVLAACVALLVGILGLVWVPLYGSRLKSFKGGDHLVDRSGAAFGVVLQSEEQHTFDHGIVVPAYLVQLASGELRWFPMHDLQGTCSRQK